MASKFVQALGIKPTGFHILSLLSLADGRYKDEEGAVILDFIENAYDGGMDLIKEQAFVKALPASERQGHFRDVVNHFYSVSTPEQRHELVRFAMNLVMADNEMELAENKLINEILAAWDLDK